MNDEERMQEAVRVFRRMIPTLSSYAKAITGRRDVRVVLAPTSAMTDGKNIFYRPPLQLGDKLKHDRGLCDRRDPVTRLQMCPACEIRERVLVNVYHEIGHIAFKSFTDLSEHDRLAAFRQAVTEMGKSHAVTLEAAQRATVGVTTYMGLAGLINPYLPTLLNGIEDARVDGMMCAARKGIRVMMQASSNQIFRDGAEGMDTKWSDYPLNAQIALACMLRIMNYDDWEEHLNPSVVEHTRMPGVEAILTRLRESRQASETFLLAYPLMEELRKYGYFQKPNEIPDMPPMGGGSDDKDEDDSGNSDSDSSEEGGDSGSSGGSSSPSEQRDEEDSSQSSDSQASSDGNADEEDAIDSDGGSGSSETTTDSDPGQDDVDEDSGDGGNNPEEGEDGSGSSGEPGDSSSTGGGIPGEQDSDPDSSDDAGDSSDSSGRDPEDGDSSTAPDRDDSTGHGGEDSDPDEGASATDEGGDVPPEDSTPTNELGEDDDGDATEPSDGDDSRGDDGGSSDQETSSSGSDEGQDDGDSDPADVPGDGDEPSEDRAGDDGQAGEDPSGDGERGVDDDAGTVGDTSEGENPEASSFDDDGEDLDDGGTSSVPDSSPGPAEEQEADDSDTAPQEQHQHGVDGQPCNCGHCTTYGTPSQVADEVDQVHTKMAHPDPDQEEDEPTAQELKDFADMIQQGLHFDTRSEDVAGVVFHRGGHRFFNAEKPTEIPEEYLGPALLQTRRTFSDNQKAIDDRNLKRGRVDAGKLAKRAPFNDPKMFQRRRQPGKKDYSVLLGMDLSSSSLGHEAEQIRLFTMAQAELCHRAGIRFAVYGHSGEGFWKEPGNRDMGIGFNMDIVVIKEFDEPWGPEALRRMSMVQPSGGNLDGHTMEFYRKRLDEERTTDRVIVYYTDGQMPATNFDEELDILQRELRTCRNKGYTVMAVGIGTDSPIEHGLDTYVAEGFEDIKGVVMHLEKRLVNR